MTLVGDILPDFGFTVTSNSTGALAAPSTFTVALTAPDGTTPAVTVTNPSTGVYAVTFVATMAGRWRAVGTAVGNSSDGVSELVWDVDALNEPIVGLEAAQDFLGMHLDAEVGTVLSVLNAATGIVERYTNQTWRRQTVTAEKHAGGKSALHLRKHPASSITTVVENGATLTADEYTYDATSGLLWRGDGTTGAVWHPGPNAVAVTYVAGASDVPDEVVEAVLGTARSLVEERRGGVRQMADEYAQPSDLIPRRHRLALSSYVLPAF